MIWTTPLLLISSLVSVVLATGNTGNGGAKSNCYDCHYDPDTLKPGNYGDDNNAMPGYPKCAMDDAVEESRVDRWACDSGKCFIRRDPNGLVYRGCADQWNLPWGVDTSRNCEYQGQKPSLFWFCDGSLCNGAKFTESCPNPPPAPVDPADNATDSASLPEEESGYEGVMYIYTDGLDGGNYVDVEWDNGWELPQENAGGMNGDQMLYPPNTWSSSYNNGNNNNGDQQQIEYPSQNQWQPAAMEPQQEAWQWDPKMQAPANGGMSQKMPDMGYQTQTTFNGDTMKKPSKSYSQQQAPSKTQNQGMMWKQPKQQMPPMNGKSPQPANNNPKSVQPPQNTRPWQPMNNMKSNGGGSKTHQMPQNGKHTQMPSNGKSQQMPSNTKFMQSANNGKSHQQPPQNGKTWQPTSNGKSQPPQQNGKTWQQPTNGKSQQPPQNGKTWQPPTNGKSPQNGKSQMPQQPKSLQQPAPSKTYQSPQGSKTWQAPSNGKSHESTQNGKSTKAWQPPTSGDGKTWQPPQNGNSMQPSNGGKPMNGNGWQPQGQTKPNGAKTPNGNNGSPVDYVHGMNNEDQFGSYELYYPEDVNVDVSPWDYQYVEEQPKDEVYGGKDSQQQQNSWANNGNGNNQQNPYDPSLNLPTLLENPCDGRCQDNPSGLFPHPLRPDWFVQCGSGDDYGESCHCCKPYYLRCSYGTTFDATSRVCGRFVVQQQYEG